MSRRLPLFLSAALLAASCSTGAGLTVPTSSEPPVETTAAPTSTTSTTTTTTIPRDCTPAPGELPGTLEGGPAEVALVLSAATFPCADEVTIAPVDDPDAAAAAALHASTSGGPLLFCCTNGPDLAAELDRLGPRLLTIADGVDPFDPALIGRETRALHPGPGIRGGIIQSDAAARLLVVGDAGDRSWPAVWVAAHAAGDGAVRAGGPDLRALPDPRLAALRSAPDAALTVVGPLNDDAVWQAEVVRTGTELPGGGLLVFPDRRLVAFYGHPQTGVLGVLGEQGLEGADATADRMAPLVEAYAGDGVPTVGAFEIITTVASAEATSDGNYSYETPIELIRPWVETAGERGLFVILDLQPGRTDFLTQARLYEELLRLPHVGLAIDPEWRLEPHQVHLRQIGSVDAAEINAVSEWLAQIVREDRLPQKILLLHQFRLDMIPDRADVELHPELAIAVQMDGQGGLQTKYGTWGVLTGQADSERFWWGWKNFYDEDFPMATPEEVFELEPTVYLVSFQ